MLNCRACIQRCLRADVADSVPLRQTQRLSPAASGAPRYRRGGSSSPWLRSRYSTASEAASLPPERNQTSQVRGAGEESGTTVLEGFRPSKLRGRESDTRALQSSASTGYEPVSRRQDFNLRAELKYLTDPLVLADRVRALLKAGDSTKALSLVRMASKDMQCPVSWNCILDHHLSQGKVNAALKTYNEMKKRSQTPDAHTYTHLLRGLSNHAHYPLALGKALAIYHSMHAPNSKVKPTIIHTNAALKVCSRANDMDSLWGIAAKLPNSGIGAPDNVTWTTILNALRQHASTSAGPGESTWEVEKRQQQAILEGRRMWDDIIGRWRKGDLWIDEGLVCAMGRLLLVGSRPRDWDDVLSLVCQTTAVPRLVPKLGTKARDRAPVPQLSTPLDEQSGSDEESGELLAGGEFESLVKRDGGGPTVSKSGKPAPFAFAPLGQKTLSLVLEACIKMRAKKTAVEYWSLLTSKDSYGIRPDENNFSTYLRLLRVMRSSDEALHVVQYDMPEARIEPGGKDYFLAMSVCARDKLNPNSFVNATTILDLMQENLPTLDVGTVSLYLDVASWTEDSKKVLTAVERVWDTNLVRRVAFDRSSGRKEEAVVLMRKMIGCYDRLMSRERGREWKMFGRKKSILAAQVTRLTPGADKSKARRRGEKGEEGKEKGEAEVEAQIQN